MAEVRLLSSTYSPFGQRVHIALEEKGIPYEVAMLDLSDKPQELLDANPIHKKVPTIVRNGKSVAESIVILEYLEDAFPEHVPLLPKDPYERSQVRFWTDYIVNHLYGVFIIPGLRSRPGSPEKLAAIEQGAKVLKVFEDAMLSYSAEGPFFTGATFGFLDVVLGPFSSSLSIMEELVGLPMPVPEELPRLWKWIRAVQEHPSVKVAVPPPEGCFEYFSAMIKRRAAAAAAKAAAK